MRQQSQDGWPLSNRKGIHSLNVSPLEMGSSNSVQNQAQQENVQTLTHRKWKRETQKFLHFQFKY